MLAVSPLPIVRPTNVTQLPPERLPLSNDRHTAGDLIPNRDASTGVLRGGATLTLHTRHAHWMVNGRGYAPGKPVIIGLTGFANLVRSIWHGARGDDPYAHWWLLKVHEALEQAEAELRAADQDIGKRFATLGAIEVSAPVSVSPVRIALEFSNPYAFRAARLLGIFDGVARSILSAQHVGVLTQDEAWKALQRGGRHVRRALQSAVGYRATGITGLDVGQGSVKASQAQDAMGDVPADICAGARKAPYAPAAVASRAPVTVPHTHPLLPDRC